MFESVLFLLDCSSLPTLAICNERQMKYRTFNFVGQLQNNITAVITYIVKALNSYSPFFCFSNDANKKKKLSRFGETATREIFHAQTLRATTMSFFCEVKYQRT